MKKEIKEKWIAALRSGEYQQTDGYLQRDGKFCCLGVLCDLAVKSGLSLTVREQRAFPDDETSPVVAFYDVNTGTLPYDVQRWSGIKDSIGIFPDDSTGLSNTLADLNDNGKSFAEIADVIEKYF